MAESSIDQGPWPQGQSGAVSLTFDDGMRSQLETAIPMLNEYDLRATFYLNPVDRQSSWPPQATDDEEVWREWLAPWRAAADIGHEIGNHSLTHPCSRNFDWMAGRPGLEDMTLDEIERDVLEAERRLNACIPSPAGRSFCYPCYQSYVGTGAARQSYVPVIARHFVAARGKGEVANDPARCDLHDLWSWPAERMSGAELVGLAERAADEGRWTILTFHGIGEGHLPVAEYDLQELCRFLDRHRTRLWTAPLAVVAARVRDWRT